MQHFVASRIKFNAKQFQFEFQWRRLCLSGHFVYSFHCVVLLLCLCACVCAYDRILKSMWLIAEQSVESGAQTVVAANRNKTYLQSQKALLEPATHGALPRLEHIDGVYVRQNVFKCELQVWSNGLHHLYQRTVLLGHSTATGERTFIMASRKQDGTKQWPAVFCTRNSPGYNAGYGFAGLYDFHLSIEHQVEGEHLAESRWRDEWSCRGGWMAWQMGFNRLVWQLAKRRESAFKAFSYLHRETPYHRWPPGHPSWHPLAIWRLH